MASRERNGRKAYTKQLRAAQEADTRLRITEAAMQLHEEVGPAHTTVTDVAARAGVSRMTVYNHFATDGELIEACSTHWSTLHPLPDPEAWRAIRDPATRRLAGLAELYAWYRQTAPMMAHIFRDAPLVPALGDLMAERWGGLAAMMVEVLAAGSLLDNELEGALRVAVDFTTWRTLTSAGLGDAAAAALAARLVTAAEST